MTRVTENEEVETLADELFTAIQRAQGYAFVSDGETFKTRPEFFARIRGRLRQSELATKIMRDFLRKYDQQPKIGRPLIGSPSHLSKR